MPRKAKEEQSLIIQNQEVYRWYVTRLCALANSQFKWQGMPDTCDPDYFERVLLGRGKACLCRPEGVDMWLSLGFNESGQWDWYRRPIGRIEAVGANGDVFFTNDYEILYDNVSRETLMPWIYSRAKRLWEIDQAQRLNLRQVSTPLFLETTAGTKLSAENFLMEVDGFKPFILAEKGKLREGEMKPTALNPAFIGNDLEALKKEYWAETLALLGISAETTKKERLISDEIVMNRQEDAISLQNRLKTRVEFCNRMNKKYGMNLSVNLTDDLNSAELNNIMDEEGREYGEMDNQPDGHSEG